MQKRTRTTLLALAALALPAAAAAQQTPAPAPQQPAPAAAPAQDELAQVQQRINALQQQALQDPAVKTEQDALGQTLLAAMERLDPASKAKAARATALQQEVAAARQAGDNARLNELAKEAQELQAYFGPLRQRGMQDPEVVARQQVFLAAVVKRMNEIDPEADKLIARMQELRAAQQAAAQPAAPAAQGAHQH